MTSPPPPRDSVAAHVEGLWLGLLDDAAALPPSEASVSAALDQHRAHRASWYAHLVGPLQLRASQLPELLTLVTAGEDLQVGLLADNGLAGLVESLGLLTDHEDRVAVHQVQIPLPAGFPASESTAALLDQLALSSTTYVEVPRTAYEGALDVIAEDGAERAAYRLGGPTEDLAGFLHAALQRRVAFRISGGMQHGALNVLAAVAASQAGGSVVDLATVLAEPEPAQLVGLLQSADVPAVRRAFIGFDCLGLAELADDLALEGLVAKA